VAKRLHTRSLGVVLEDETARFQYHVSSRLGTDPIWNLHSCSHRRMEKSGRKVCQRRSHTTRILFPPRLPLPSSESKSKSCGAMPSAVPSAKAIFLQTRSWPSRRSSYQKITSFCNRGMETESGSCPGGVWVHERCPTTPLMPSAPGKQGAALP